MQITINMTILSDDNILYNPPPYYLLVYYCIIPTTTVVGLLGNIATFYVIWNKFATELAFVYQIAIIAADIFALISTAYYTVGYCWGLGNGIIMGKEAERSAFWFERSYCRRFLLQYVFDPLRHYFVSITPWLLVGTSVDRIIALTYPVYYRADMNRKLSFALFAVVSCLLGIPVALDAGLGRLIKEVPINTTDEGIVFVYKREVMLDYWRSAGRSALAVTSNCIRLSSLLCFCLLSVVVICLCYRTRKRRTNSMSRRRHRSGLTVVNEKLLLQLLLAQAVLVSFVSIPYSLLSLTPNKKQHNLNTLLLHITRDLGYALQASLTVFCYTLVSEQFRNELKRLIRLCCCTSPDSEKTSSEFLLSELGKSTADFIEMRLRKTTAITIAESA